MQKINDFQVRKHRNNDSGSFKQDSMVRNAANDYGCHFAGQIDREGPEVNVVDAQESPRENYNRYSDNNRALLASSH